LPPPKTYAFQVMAYAFDNTLRGILFCTFSFPIPDRIKALFCHRSK
jgi:hypothetical protein